MKTAVIDLGTNTFHLLIAKVNSNGTWQRLYRKRITVKLGQGGIHRGIITPQAYRRGFNAVRNFHRALSEHKVQRVRACGTAMLRTAANGPDFLGEIREQFGITVKVISGKEEAMLIYRGVRQAVDMGTQPSLIMDIGGGSTEFIIANSKKIFWKASYRVGASFLVETFRPSNPLSSSENIRIRKHLNQTLQSLLIACKKFKPCMLIGSAGSFETFASMIRHRHPDSGSHYGKTMHPIAMNHYRSLHRDLLSSTTEERKKMRGLIMMRVDMIVPATILLNFVVEKTGIPEMMLSAYALKEGMLVSGKWAVAVSG